MKFGCSLWQSGAGDVENDCENYDQLFDKCSNIASGVPLLSDFSIFFEDSSIILDQLKNQSISKDNCDSFKLRTGCLVRQFKNACKSEKSAELPWWMAQYQIDLSLTNSTQCRFNKDDTPDNMMSKYDTTQSSSSSSNNDNGNGNVDAGNNQAQQNGCSSQHVHATFFYLMSVVLFFLFI